MVTLEGLSGVFEIKLNKFNVIKKEKDPKKQTTVHDKYLNPIKKFLWPYYEDFDSENVQKVFAKLPVKVDGIVALSNEKKVATIPTLLKSVDKILLKQFEFKFESNGE